MRWVLTLLLAAVLALGCSKHLTKATLYSEPATPAAAVVTMDLAGDPGEDTQGLQAPETLPVYFDFDAAQIRPYGLDNLLELAAFLQNEPALSVQIDGYCDERGSEAYNMALGQRRADAVKSWLKDNGVKNEILTISHGKSMAAAYSTETCWQQDRKSIINIK
jgi:peptidoglycan-associated lipoprotein